MVGQGGSYGGSYIDIRNLMKQREQEQYAANVRMPLKELKIPTSSIGLVFQAWIDKTLGNGLIVERVEEKDGEVTVTFK